MLAADPAAQRALRTVLDDVHGVVEARLRELKCEVPAGFRVEVTYVKITSGVVGTLAANAGRVPRTGAD